MDRKIERGIARRIGKGDPLRQMGVSGEKLNEFFDRVDAEFAARRRFYDGGVIADTRWNGWRLDPSKLTLALVTPDDWPTYTLDLFECAQPAAVLDWIVQVSGKDWRPNFDTDQVTLGLLYAFDDVLHLQESMCSFGHYQELNEEQLRDRVATFVHQFNEGEQP